MHDALGVRMKENYESRTRQFLPRRTYTLIRIDGKAFHTYTRGCAKPFDFDLMDDMAETAKALCENIQGAALAYTQSDEITILLTDFGTITTDAWFDGNVQKICSISASMAAAHFNHLRLVRSSRGVIEDYFVQDLKDGKRPGPLAYFDSRCWTIPDPIEVENVFVWRQQDAVRNSIQMVAQSLYSQNQLQGRNKDELQEMIFQKGINWNDYPVRAKRGTCIIKEMHQIDVENRPEIVRPRWVIKEPPTFTQDRSFLRGIIPTYEEFKWKENTEEAAQ